jgi:hypothetical protein
MAERPPEMAELSLWLAERPLALVELPPVLTELSPCMADLPPDKAARQKRTAQFQESDLTHYGLLGARGDCASAGARL